MGRLLVGGGQHAPNEPGQRQQRACRGAQRIRLCRRRLIDVGSGTPHQASPAVGQTDSDELGAARASQRQQHQPLAMQRVMRINNLDFRDQPVGNRGRPKCSAMPKWPRPCSIASPTTATSSRPATPAGGLRTAADCHPEAATSLPIAVDRWPAYARLSTVASAGHLPAAPSPTPLRQNQECPG